MDSRPPSVDDELIRGIIRQLETISPVTLAEPARWRTAAADHGGRVGARGSRPVRVATAGMCVAGAAVAFTLVSSSPSRSPTAPAEAHALPVFNRPAVNATRVRSQTPTLAAHAASYNDARAFQSTTGTGYAMTAENGLVCLAIPDTDGYGQSCASKDKIEHRGLYVALVGSQGGSMAAVLPATATDARLDRSDGSTDRLPIIDGIVTASASAHERARASYMIGTRRTTITLYEKNPGCLLIAGSPTPATLDRIKRESTQKLCEEQPLLKGTGGP